MFTTEILKLSAEKWQEIKDDIITLEQEAFGDKSYTNDELAADFSNENNIAVILKDGESNSIVGFRYAKPIEEAEPERANEKGETAYLWDIVIKKEYRGRHLSEILMASMEQELKRQNYKYMDLCAVRANNYADNIAKACKDRIVASNPVESKWGPQVYFRIKL